MWVEGKKGEVEIVTMEGEKYRMRRRRMERRRGRKRRGVKEQEGIRVEENE